MAVSSADVEQWLQSEVIPITKWTPPQKSRYVGVRDSSHRAVECYVERCRKENKHFAEEDTRVLERCLDSEAYIRMSTEKFDELGRGWVTCSHYVSYLKTTEDWVLMLFWTAIRLNREWCICLLAADN